MDEQQINTAYLTAALGGLRLRLVEFAHRRMGAGGERSPTGPDGEWQAQLAEAEAARARLAASDPSPAFEVLACEFGLSSFEKDVLLLCAATELDRAVPPLCGAALDSDENAPTLGLALELFPDARWDVLSPERPLRRWDLLEIVRRGTLPLTASPIRIDPRVLHFLRGLPVRDERLSGGAMCPFDVDADAPLACSQEEALPRMQVAWQAGLFSPRPTVFLMTGSDHLSRQALARRFAARQGADLYRLPAALLPTDAGEIEQLARLWAREARLAPLLLFVDTTNVDPSSLVAFGPLMRFLANCPPVAFISGPDRLDVPGRSMQIIEVDYPTRGEQRHAWQERLNASAAASAAARLLAGQFRFSIGRIAELAPLKPPPGESFRDDLWDRCRDASRTGMDALTQRIDIKATWDDLVVGEEERSLLGAIAGQVRNRLTVLEEWGFEARSNRGLGVTALFAGESGTGKTMAAEVIAQDLRLDLYRIDLSQVVNKYIGETEKNLRRVFDAADVSGAILFFDEADALFGKRSEVRDSHDRYANIEVNYLLQRMESYRGLAILATNLKSSLDPAFLRRLRFVVDFPFPTVSLRRRLWERAFPAATPLDRLDLDHLAKLHLAGGSIANIALNAAFAAAAESEPVGMPSVLAAAKAEYRKLQRPINAAEFTWRRPAVLGGV